MKGFWHDETDSRPSRRVTLRAEGDAAVWKKILIGVALLVVFAVGGVVAWIGPRNVIGIMTYGQQAREGSLVVGDAAPVVSVIDLDGATERTLDEWVGARPLVLVFGSFT